MSLMFFSKYAWVFLLKDKKGITIADVFQKILNNSKKRPNWLIKAGNFIKVPLKNV